MLKIKKLLFIFGCSLALLMGCSNGNETVETKKEIIIQNNNNYKGIFVVKYNYSDNFLPAKETGNFKVKNSIDDKNNKEHVLLIGDILWMKH